MNDHPCPVCGTPTALFDVVDFNKTCLPLAMPLSGKPVYYSRCPACQFTFAPELHGWSDDAFLANIYNDGYVDVDPDYVRARPVGNADWLDKTFGSQKHAITHLDYGGGNGTLSEILRGAGWNSASFDPFPRSDTALGELGKFNLITAFEVFEHVPDVTGLMDNLAGLMAERCLVLFSTNLVDGNVKPNERLTWWYASPRNGHISLFSARSLQLLGARHNLTCGSLSEGTHCFFNQLPAWAEPR